MKITILLGNYHSYPLDINNLRTFAIANIIESDNIGEVSLSLVFHSQIVKV